jgi:hypothetical protein
MAAKEGMTMGFFAGRATFARYRLAAPSPRLFSTDHLDRLAAHKAGRQRLAAADGVEVGWTAGDHILDTRFDLAKNVVNDTLHFALRVDTTKIPGDLLKAYYVVELETLSANNPSGKPSTRQKREARESARERLEEEAKDGRFLQRRAVEVLWDAQLNELLVGTTALTQIDRLHTLFERTFGFGFEAVTAGRRAFQLAESHRIGRGVDDASPSAFVPGLSPEEVAWIPDEASRDFLGNEFLLWLWYVLDSESDSILLSDGSEAAVLLARTLTLECPRGQTGYETITSDGPARLPEAKRALQAGKMPRKCGLTVARHDATYELSMQAETLAVGSAKIPPLEEVTDDRARLDERVNQLRHLIETLDLLYEAFVQRRCGAEWSKELAKVQKWLAREERRHAATANGQA